MLWVTKHGRRVKCLFGNFYFSTFISPFDQSVSVSQFVSQVSKPILVITRLSYEMGYIIVVDALVPFRYGKSPNLPMPVCLCTSSYFACTHGCYTLYLMYEHVQHTHGPILMTSWTLMGVHFEAKMQFCATLGP